MDNRIKKVMSQVFGADESSISSNASPENLLNWDSLGHMNLILALEEEFKIQFDENQIVHLLSFEEIRRAIAAKQA